MSIIKSEWGTDCYGQRCLIVRKKRGNISQKELADHLRYERHEFGTYVSILNATESTCDVGWPEEDSQGDMVALYLYDDDERCPVCAHMAIPNYCPHCGNSIDPLKDYQEPLQVFRGNGERAKSAYQVSCTVCTEGDCSSYGCGVSDSMDGIMRLIREHIQGVMYLAPDDPFLTIPPPAVEKLPATLVYEWDDARVQVEYSVGLVEVLLGDEADKESHGGGIWQKDPWEYGGGAGEPLTF